MKGPHGHDLFMSCISELVLETREVSTVFQKINFFFFGSKHKCQSSFLGCWCMCCSAMYCPFILGSIGHFRVPKTLTFKLRPSAQPFLCKWVLSAWEWKIIPISKAEHLTSFWYSGTGIRNGLFVFSFLWFILIIAIIPVPEKSSSIHSSKYLHMQFTGRLACGAKMYYHYNFCFQLINQS